MDLLPSHTFRVLVCVAVALILCAAVAYPGWAGAAVRDTPNCSADDFSGSASLQGATGSLLGVVNVRNVSSGTCLLPRWPTVSVYLGQRNLDTKDVLWENFNPDNRTQRVGLLKARQHALVELMWRNWCGTKPTESSLGALSLRLAFADSSSLTVPLASQIQPPRCDSTHDPSSLEISRFYTT
jgi:hypothetical protein